MEPSNSCSIFLENRAQSERLELIIHFVLIHRVQSARKRRFPCFVQKSRRSTNTVQKSHQNHTKTMPTPCQHHIRILLKPYQNHANTIPTSSQKHAKFKPGGPSSQPARKPASRHDAKHKKIKGHQYKLMCSDHRLPDETE